MISVFCFTQSICVKRQNILKGHEFPRTKDLEFFARISLYAKVLGYVQRTFMNILLYVRHISIIIFYFLNPPYKSHNQ